MILWHKDLLQVLPTRLLCALHRDVCLCKGKGWGGSKALAFVWRDGFTTLHSYHLHVMGEMRRRGWEPGNEWLDPFWRGKGYGRISPDGMTYGSESWPDLHAQMGYQVQRLLKALGNPKLWKNGEMEKFTSWIGKRVKV